MTKASNRERKEVKTSNKGTLANHSAAEAECHEPKCKRNQRRDYRAAALEKWKQRISRLGKRKKKEWKGTRKGK